MTDGDGSAIEVEWQFEASDLKWLATWLDGMPLDGYSVRTADVQQITDRYFDTGDWRVHRAGYTARVRSVGGVREVTLKERSAASGGGPRRRREITSTIRGTTPDAALGASGLAGTILRALSGRQELRELFTLRTRRARYDLRLTGGDRLGEIALDTTVIRAGETTLARLSRVEVEVDGAREDEALPFIDRLALAAGLVPARTSKLEAAMAVAGLTVESPEAALSGLPPLKPAMPASQAIRVIVAQRFAALLQHEAGTRVGDDIEELHDMRVASRRIRAALKTFAAYGPPRLVALAPEYQWLGSVLGEVRDLDVQIERFRGWATEFESGPDGGLDAAIEALERRRETARERMLAALESRRYQLLLRQTLEQLLSSDGPEHEMSIAEAAAETIESRYNSMRKHSKRIDADSPDAVLHDLRKRVRKLRYAIEFVEPLYGAKLRDLRGALVALQDVLGDHQDLSVTEQMLRELVAHETALPRAAAFTLGMVAERNRAAAAGLRDQVAPALAKVYGKRWDRARKVLQKGVTAGR